VDVADPAAAAPLVALVDDDGALLSALAAAIEARGWRTVTASDGEQGLALGRRDDVDAMIADVNMPRLDGFSLCRKLREEGRLLPILLLTSRDTEVDEALGLDLGADDYVSKPFSVRVLLARVAALLRRRQPPAAGAAPTALTRRGEITLDPGRLEVSVRGSRLQVTVTEFRILDILARRPGFVFSRERLLEEAREDDSVVAPRLVDTYVARLRRKIDEAAPGLAPIETVIGAGYRFRDG
jgi:DNA-binding response OmpR family regulator